MGQRAGFLVALALLAGPAVWLTVPGQAAAPASTAEPWWEPLSLRGQVVMAVAAGAGGVAVEVAGRALLSRDQGRTFVADAAGAEELRRSACTLELGCRARGPGGRSWRLAHGRVISAPAGSAAEGTLAGSPDLGEGARLIAAPAALPGTLLAVAADGTVWRRGRDGGWSRALLLLPQHLLQGPPPITSLVAFEVPRTAAVYLATGGYSVLVSGDGGIDWIRAGPGLPDRVLALAADSRSGAVYAATADGLWVHHLRPLPAPPSYAQAGLWWRWLGLIILSAVVSAGAVAVMLRAMPPPRS